MQRRPSDEFNGARDPKPENAATKRPNWSLLAAVCLGLGVVIVGAVVVVVFFGRGVAPGPLEQLLHAVAQPVDVGPNANETLSSARSVPEPATRMQALLPQEALADEQGADERADEPSVVSQSINPAEPMASVTTTVVVRFEPAVAGSVGAQTLNAPDTLTGALPSELPTTAPSGTMPLGSVAPATAGSEVPPPSLSELPSADLGFTYCGAVTCNVGFKCCCSACVPADQECAAAECEAYAGLSVSVACGMDLCAAGEVCCDPTCAACAPAGECPEEPCP